jgi:aryl-alcohol dehydrogenase-like predicted oxidoreductase
VRVRRRGLPGRITVIDTVNVYWRGAAEEWVLRVPNVAAAIVGASRPEQVAENAAASGLELDDTAPGEIDGVLAP